MIELTDIAYVRSGVADLHKAVTFATEIVGLEPAASTEDGVAHLRAGRRHHCLSLVEGTSGVIASGFAVADGDVLAAAETEPERAGPPLPSVPPTRRTAPPRRGKGGSPARHPLCGWRPGLPLLGFPRNRALQW